MTIPTEPIGSIPRPPELLEAVEKSRISDPALGPIFDAAIRDTIERFEATGSPIITDGEQRKYENFWTYSVHGLRNTAPDGFRIPFAAGHTRRMPRLTEGPFRYERYADAYLEVAARYTDRPLKQAVISPSALSLMYPDAGIPGYSREEFIEDLLTEHVTEIRRCLDRGAAKVQVDFTEGRLAMKIDPSGNLLTSFIDLNNLALARLSAEQRRIVAVHTCPGGDRDSTHSADVDYSELLPSLFELNVGSFCIALAGEPDRIPVLPARPRSTCRSPARTTSRSRLRSTCTRSKTARYRSSLLFAGTTFTSATSGSRSSRWRGTRRPRSACRCSLARQMDHYFPNSGWIRLSRETLDALTRFKAERALPTWDRRSSSC